MKQEKGPISVFITGASRGIGKALAVHYAANFYKPHLYLIARNLENLLEVQNICESFGAKVSIASIDVQDYYKMKEFFNNIPTLDISILNAGISYGTANGPEEYTKVKEVVDTNINGFLNGFLLSQDKFINQKHGHIVSIASLAGINPLPSCPIYSSSKAFVQHYSLCQSSYLKQYGINVTNINPGFIATDMTSSNQFPMPFVMRPEKAAEKIASAIQKKREIYSFPYIMKLSSFFLSMLPRPIFSYITNKLPKKH